VKHFVIFYSALLLTHAAQSSAWASPCDDLIARAKSQGKKVERVVARCNKVLDPYFKVWPRKYRLGSGEMTNRVKVNTADFCMAKVDGQWAFLGKFDADDNFPIFENFADSIDTMNSKHHIIDTVYSTGSVTQEISQNTPSSYQYKLKVKEMEKGGSLNVSVRFHGSNSEVGEGFLGLFSASYSGSIQIKFDGKRRPSGSKKKTAHGITITGSIIPLFMGVTTNLSSTGRFSDCIKRKS